MRIARFKVERYRSIESSESIDLSTLTVLVGPNNEGKSNILRALVVGLEAIRALTSEARYSSRSQRLSERLRNFESYVWERDFPVHLQVATPRASSVFEFEFLLDQKDVDRFRREIGHSLNGELKLRVLLFKDGKAEFKVVKRGPGSAGLNEKIRQIAAYVTRRVRVEYIPVSRTFDRSEQLVRREAAAAVRDVQDSPEYKNALATLDGLIRAGLSPLGERLLDGVREFLPEVHEVSVEADSYRAWHMMPEIDVIVDDGSPTSLSTKGDGIQSLVTISLVKAHAKRTSDATYILAVEEPEAHLHPGAVHKLRRVLREIAEEDQVILTTHSPIFVNRSDPRSNILVRSNSAAPAVSLSEVRESLGIELPDNMRSAEAILLCEGALDVRIVKRVLANSHKLSDAMRLGRLQIMDAGGAAHVPYQRRVLTESACRVHVLLDDDKEGRSALRDLEKSPMHRPQDVTLASVAEMSESEIEDLLDQGIYEAVLLAEFNVVMDASVTAAEKKFSHRMKDCFAASGQSYSSSAASNLKTSIALAVEGSTGDVLAAGREGPMAALVRALEKKVGDG